MSLLQRMIVNLLLERPARRLGVDKLQDNLRTSGERLAEHFARITPDERGRALLRHIIAIERWGQNRLRVALGQPLVIDSSQDYKPEAALPWDALVGTFKATRQETLELAQQLVQQHVAFETTVVHNQFGELSLLGWLRYLHVHASLEAKKLRASPKR
jgi:hypothetical protein